MEPQGGASRRHRLVALVGPAARLPDWADVAGTSSGYEAAAELLSAPASALVVDLARLLEVHLPLLDLARRLQVPIIAFGTVSGTLEGHVLAGVRLVGPDAVGRVLGEMLSVVGSYQRMTATEAATEETPVLPLTVTRPAEPDRGESGDGSHVAARTHPGASPSRPPGPLSRSEIDALLEESP